MPLTFQVVIFMPRRGWRGEMEAGRRLRRKVGGQETVVASPAVLRVPARDRALVAPARRVSHGAMRSLWSLPLLLLPLACATPTHLVSTANDTIVTVAEAADALATADVVALGEMHNTPAVHELHLALIQELHARRGRDLVIAMEMFERDVQAKLLMYLSGDLDEGRFREDAREWPHYVRDYRPVVQFAKRNGVIVLAANAPRPLAATVAREGLAAVQGDPNVARTVSAPEDDYWEAFLVAMKGHPGVSAEKMQRMYQAQCLKDDTMAESIVDYVQRQRGTGRRPLVVLICGHMHSDYRRGTVARVLSRWPGCDARVLSVETTEDVGLGKGVYRSPRAVGDFVVVVPAAPEERSDEVVAVARPAASATGAQPSAQPAAKPAATNPEGLQPALNLMPGDYSGEGKGVLVGSVTAGGSAEKAGIEAGDVITALGGIEVQGVEHYTELLGKLTIGKVVTVRVRREGAEVDLQVTVGSRAARR
jgi:uncharacterized iron-regulated protein